MGVHAVQTSCLIDLGNLLVLLVIILPQTVNPDLSAIRPSRARTARVERIERIRRKD